VVDHGLAALAFGHVESVAPASHLLELVLVLPYFAVKLLLFNGVAECFLVEFLVFFKITH